MSERDMLEIVKNLIINRFNDTNMILHKDQALQTQKLFYEISLIISNFFHKGFKRGGGIITPFNNINRNIQKGITDFAHGFKNELDKITNGTGLLIMSIYQNIIFQKIDNYTLKNPKHFKDIENIIIILLKDLLNRYNNHKYPQKFYVMGGKKIKKKKKKGGVAESIMITGIIISAIWALIQMYDNIFQKYEKWVDENERNSQAKPPREIQKINDQVKPKTPKTPKTPKKQGFFDVFGRFPKI